MNLEILHEVQKFGLKLLNNATQDDGRNYSRITKICIDSALSTKFSSSNATRWHSSEHQILSKSGNARSVTGVEREANLGTVAVEDQLAPS